MQPWKNYVAIDETFMMPISFYETFENFLEDGDKETAVEFIRAVCQYNFFGQEYDGSSREVRNILVNLMPLIDSTKIKYRQASKGGRGNASISDEELLELWESGQYKSKAELGRTLGITGQAVGQRLKRIETKLSFETKTQSFETETPTFETENPLSPLLARIKQAH